MKTIYSTMLALGLAAVLSPAAMAQNMVIRVPGNAQVVTSGDRSDNNGVFWLCGGGSVDGNTNTVYIGQNVNANIDGNNNVVYSVSPGTIHVNGNNNVVYTNTSSRVTVNGNNNAVHAPSGVQVTFDGNNNSRQSLTVLSFDYTSAPAGGCAPTTTLPPRGVGGELIGLPQPVLQGERVVLQSSKEVAGELYLTDLQGRLIQTYPAGTKELSTRNVPAGMYRLKAVVGGQPVAMPFVVQ